MKVLVMLSKVIRTGCVLVLQGSKQDTIGMDHSNILRHELLFRVTPEVIFAEVTAKLVRTKMVSLQVKCCMEEKANPFPLTKLTVPRTSYKYANNYLHT